MKDELGAKFKPSVEPYWNETNLSERLSNCLAIFSSLTVLFWKLIPKTSADWFINIILVQDCQENPSSPFAVLYTCVNCVRWFSESDVKDKCWLFRFSLTFSWKERRDYRRMVAGRWRRTSRGAEMSSQWVSTLKHKIRKGGAEGIQLHLAHSYTDAYDKLQWQLSSHEKALSCAEKCCYVGRDIIHTWRNSLHNFLRCNFWIKDSYYTSQTTWSFRSLLFAVNYCKSSAEGTKPYEKKSFDLIIKSKSDKEWLLLLANGSSREKMVALLGCEKRSRCFNCWRYLAI